MFNDECDTLIWSHNVLRIYDVMVAPNLYGDIISYDIVSWGPL